LVAYIEALLVLSPYGRPSDSRIAAIADAHFNQALASLNVLTDVDFKAYMERKAGEFFKAYGFVAREGEEAGTPMLLPPQQPRRPPQPQKQRWQRRRRRRPAHLATVLIIAC
jgi:hypothetical protein